LRLELSLSVQLVLLNELFLLSDIASSKISSWYGCCCDAYLGTGVDENNMLDM
jgi:hypothetical protein